jgi:alkylation response protein AidB-like acyl-CoA dehydrogenase
MSQYVPPLRDIQFLMHELFDAVSVFQAIPQYADLDADTINQVLEEGGKFCASVLAPLNAVGDTEGCTLNLADHSVKTPPGFKEAYAQFVEAGWPRLACDPEYGGQGLPVTINQVFYEMLNSANQAWTMYPGLTHGAYDCLHAHGSPEQKALYLPKLISGQWTGTMCLTEPHCGTDLGLLKAKAEPQSDGTYRITGGKIFISSGEHDFTENIIHLVLARLPDAPKGTKGISLFLVPKFIPHADGTLGARNTITCGALEHKMGIHGNATCQMNLDGATGWLIGSPHQGLQAMFVMMNTARLGVGMQSLGLTEVAYQNAVVYAKDRRQSRALTGAKQPDQAADKIIVHSDVRRMLLTARAYAEGARALAVWTALELDKELSHPDEDVRREAADMVTLATPVVKAFVSDNAWEATSLCMQVYGGHGYISEWGMEQFVRDSRINMIYEGTNTIQSLDLLGRKVLADRGAKLLKFGMRVRALCAEQADNEAMKEFIEPLADLVGKVTKLTMEVGEKAQANPDEVGAAAVDYLRVIGHLFYSYFFALAAKQALEKQQTDAPFYQAKLHTIRFYFQKLLPETAMLIRKARAGSGVLMDMDETLF